MYIGVIRGPFCCYDSSQPARTTRDKQNVSVDRRDDLWFFFSSQVLQEYIDHYMNEITTPPTLHIFSPLLWGVDDGSRPAVTSQTFRNWHFLYIEKEMEGISYGGTIYKTILWHWWVFRCCCCVYINLKRETMSDPVILCLFAPSYDNSTLYTI